MEKVDLLACMESAGTAVISGHVRPDGDCAGSCLALYRYLKQNTEAKITVCLEPLTGELSNLPGAGEVVTLTGKGSLPDIIPDVFFCLDCGDEGRLGDAGKLFSAAKKTVCIDHHITNSGRFADLSVVVPDASSTSEILFELMQEDKIDRELAECLYTGIIHDTGVFHHSCTGARTMEIAGKLMAKGIDFPALIDRGFYQKTYIQNQILGRCLMESMLLWDGIGIVSYLNREAMNFYGIKSSDLGGVIDQLRLTKGVEVAIFLYETETPLSYKVSMRANTVLDVSKVAAYFGGGGHKLAAGCTMNGTAHDVINNLTEQIEMQLVELGKVSASD